MQVPIEHPAPSVSVVKELYANALNCARPDCVQPLHRIDTESGIHILNEVARVNSAAKSAFAVSV